MGRAFDHNRGGRDKWIAWLSERLSAARRTLKPGHYGLVWALPRVSHWTGMACEDAGFILDEMTFHIFGSGFPKNKNKLKPAVECWWLVRNPGPAAALNIDACRVGTGDNLARLNGGTDVLSWGGTYGAGANTAAQRAANGEPPLGRWPAHLLLSHSPGCVPCGVKRVRSTEAGTIRRTALGLVNDDGWQPKETPRPGYADADGTEQVDAWRCQDGCAVAALGEMSGNCPTGKPTAGAQPSTLNAYGEYAGRSLNGGGDAGTAARYFTNLDPPEYEPPVCALCGHQKELRRGIMRVTQEEVTSCNHASSANNYSSLSAQADDSALESVSERIPLGFEGNDLSKSRPVCIAASNSQNGYQTIAHSVQGSVWDWQSEPLAQLVLSVANLCGTCAIGIARSIVAMAQDNTDSLRGLDSMPEHSARILRQSLAAYVASLVSSGTTPTIANLRTLFGSVEHAISTYTTSEYPEEPLSDLIPWIYSAKSSRRERSDGCDGLYWLADDARPSGYRPITSAEYDAAQEAGERVARGNMHPCVKSLKLISWLCTLISSPGDVVLDPFAGSGSIGVAALGLGRQFVGIEENEDYMTIAECRLAHAAARPQQMEIAI